MAFVQLVQGCCTIATRPLYEKYKTFVQIVQSLCTISTVRTLAFIPASSYLRKSISQSPSHSPIIWIRGFIIRKKEY